MEPHLQVGLAHVQRRVERALVAKVGALAFAVALGVPATLSPLSARASVDIASAVEQAPIPRASADLASPEMRPARASAVSVLFDDLQAGSAPSITAAATASPRIASAFPPAEPLVQDGVVVASWYGPGFYGDRTACGQTYTPEIAGVAHRLLPCGTPVRITSPAGVTVVVPVIDRGPYIAGRALDLSSATRSALSCSDLCRVHMTVVEP